MTMSLAQSQPATFAEDSTAVAEITADAKKMATELAVRDSGEFSAYMDAGKFAQLWRVGVAFSQSQMVPDHFKRRPADCFIICQMAMRLGIDPFMLLQKTYIISGRPGMEAQIAIALVNSSGLYKSSIRYDLSGQGEERGCVAWVIDRDGNRLDGPRVSMATAKAEGWTNRNGSKWKTIPELMLCYRAALWFSRLHCPERLMGMLTSDELQEIEGTDQPQPMVARAVAAGGTDAVRAALKQREAEKTPSDETSQERPKDTESGNQSDDSPAAKEAENAATLDGPDFANECIRVLTESGVEASESMARVGRWLPAHKLVKKGIKDWNNVAKADRLSLYLACAAGKLDAKGKIIA